MTRRRWALVKHPRGTNQKIAYVVCKPVANLLVLQYIQTKINSAPNTDTPEDCAQQEMYPTIMRGYFFGGVGLCQARTVHSSSQGKGPPKSRLPFASECLGANHRRGYVSFPPSCSRLSLCSIYPSWYRQRENLPQKVIPFPKSDTACTSRPLIHSADHGGSLASPRLRTGRPVPMLLLVYSSQ